MNVELAVVVVVLGACMLMLALAGLIELVRRRRERWLIVSAQVSAVKSHRAHDVAGSECPDTSESATPRQAS